MNGQERESPRSAPTPRRRGIERFLQRRWGDIIAGLSATLGCVVAIGAVLAAFFSGGGSTKSVGVATPTSAATPSANGSTATFAGSSPAAPATFVRGVVLAENGSTWTVRTKDGKTLAVMITTDTQFGTKNEPATRSQFAVGSDVVIVVLGKNVNESITAKRIRAPSSRVTATSPTH